MSRRVFPVFRLRMGKLARVQRTHATIDDKLNLGRNLCSRRPTPCADPADGLTQNFLTTTAWLILAAARAAEPHSTQSLQMIFSNVHDASERAVTGEPSAPRAQDLDRNTDHKTQKPGAGAGFL